MSDKLKDLIEYRMLRAYEALEEAQIMADVGHWNTCANRLYYSCFYAIRALLISKNIPSSKKTGVGRLFNLHFVKTGLISEDQAKLYNDLLEILQKSIYDDFWEMKRMNVYPRIEDTLKFLGKIESIIEKNG